MDWGAGLAIILTIIVILSLIGLIVFLLFNGGSLNASCTSQSGCRSGYVCDALVSGGPLCKVGLHQSCSENNSCSNGYFCISGICQLGPEEASGVEGASTIPPSPSTPGPSGGSKELVFSDETMKRILSNPNNLVMMSKFGLNKNKNNNCIAEETPNTNTNTGTNTNTNANGNTNANANTNIVKWGPVSETKTDKPLIDTSPFILDNIVDPRLSIPKQEGQIRLPRYDIPKYDQSLNNPVLLQNTFNVVSNPTTNKTISEDARTGCSQAIDIVSNDDTDSFESLNDSPCILDKGIKMTKSKIEIRCKHDSGKVNEYGVIDVCSYSSNVLFLLDSGNIIKDGPTERGIVIINNVKLEHIESNGGYLYGLSKGSVYRLDSNTYSLKKWRWSLCNWSPIGIRSMSSTLDGKNLFLQNESVGYIYNAGGGGQVKEVRMLGKRRVYGLDLNNYIDFDLNNKTAIIVNLNNRSSDKIEKDVRSGVLTYHNEPIFLRECDTHIYQEIRLVNWIPYYIKI